MRRPGISSNLVLELLHGLGAQWSPVGEGVPEMTRLEKIPWEGEFTLRSDSWAGLIASCGSFYLMVPLPRTPQLTSLLRRWTPFRVLCHMAPTSSPKESPKGGWHVGTLKVDLDPEFTVSMMGAGDPWKICSDPQLASWNQRCWRLHRYFS